MNNFAECFTGVRELFCQKPGTPLRLIYPDFNQTGGRNVVLLCAYFVRQAQELRQLLTEIEGGLERDDELVFRVRLLLFQ